MFERFTIFLKAQISAFSGGAADYLLMIVLTELFHVHYTVSIAISGVVGAVINFSLNKRWTFYSGDNPYQHSIFHQLLKFSQVVINSILLKVSGTYLITNWLGIDYKISRIMTDLLVSIVNFLLQKHWVFRKRPLL